MKSASYVTARWQSSLRRKPWSTRLDARMKPAIAKSTPTARFPVEELAEAIGFHSKDNCVPLVALIGAIIGGLTGYLMQYYIAVISYPVNVGGRPYHSWPSFIIVTFEMTILFGAISAVFGMLALNGLPMPYHPVFNVPALCVRDQRSFFPDRVFHRSQIRHARNAEIP